MADLDPRERQAAVDLIKQIHGAGMTILLVEQSVVEALQLADRGYVLQTGKIILQGTGQELLKSDLVRQAYLGM